MKKQENTKQKLFENMHKIAGMTLNEDMYSDDQPPIKGRGLDENDDGYLQKNQFYDELEVLVRKYIENGLHVVHVLNVLDDMSNTLDTRT